MGSRNFTVRAYADCLYQVNRVAHGYMAEVWSPEGNHYCTNTYSRYRSVVRVVKWSCHLLQKWGDDIAPDDLIPLDCYDFIFKGWIVKLNEESSATGKFRCDLLDPLGEHSLTAWLTQFEALEYITQVERSRFISPGQLKLRGVLNVHSSQLINH